MALGFVDRLSGYAGLSGREVEALRAAVAEPRSVTARQELIREGDDAGPMLVMIAGWGFAYRMLPGGSRQVVAILMPGDACDLEGETDHSIQAMTDAQVAVIPARTTVALMRSPGLARAMYVARLVEERTLRAWIVSMGRRSSAERVAQMLLELYRRAERLGLADGGTVELPLSQVVLADALGMTAVHINRVLQELRRAGAVDLQRRVLRIVDQGTLARIAGFDMQRDGG